MGTDAYTKMGPEHAECPAREGHDIHWKPGLWLYSLLGLTWEVEKLGLRAVVSSEQSPHLLLPLTSFGPQGHKIPAEFQPRISSDECAVYRAACDSSRQNKIHSWIASASDSTDTESLHGTDGQEKNPSDEARDYWENREGRWVRVHGIARRTLHDPMHDEQPFCQNLTERRRTTVRFLGQQSEMTIDDTWPQVSEM